MFVSITDDDDAEYVENMSSKIINSKDVHDLFSKRYGWMILNRSM